MGCSRYVAMNCFHYLTLKGLLSIKIAVGMSFGSHHLALHDFFSGYVSQALYKDCMIFFLTPPYVEADRESDGSWKQTENPTDPICWLPLHILYQVK